MSTKGMRKNIIFGVFLNSTKHQLITRNMHILYSSNFSFNVKIITLKMKWKKTGYGRVLSCPFNKIDTGIQYS